MELFTKCLKRDIETTSRRIITFSDAFVKLKIRLILAWGKIKATQSAITAPWVIAFKKTSKK